MTARRPLRAAGTSDEFALSDSLVAGLFDFAQIDDFFSVGSSTWTKPVGALFVEVIVQAGGGGGGSGRKGAAGTNRSGGAGGSKGSLLWWSFLASDLGSTETVVIGAGGAGGTSQTTDSTNGTAGSVGGDSSFGAYLVATGGLGGAGGSTSFTTSIPPPGDVTLRGGFYRLSYPTVGSFAGNWAGGSPRNVAGLSTAGVVIRTPSFFSTGGGLSGNLSSTNVASPGAGLGSSHPSLSDPSGGAVDNDGVNGAVGSGGAYLYGNGGTGGGAASAIKAGKGGDGAPRGCGGGAGGAGVNGSFDSGAGGNGGTGFVRVISYF